MIREKLSIGPYFPHDDKKFVLGERPDVHSLLACSLLLLLLLLILLLGLEGRNGLVAAHSVGWRVLGIPCGLAKDGDGDVGAAWVWGRLVWL